MTPLTRVVAVGVPHHMTQRGNARQFILKTDADRKVYLDLLRQSIELHSLAGRPKVLRWKMFFSALQVLGTCRK